MISYAGVPLLLDTDEIHEWIHNNWGSWDEYFADDTNAVSQSFSWLHRRGIKSPKIGKLYWPNGATRWAVGCFLASGSQLANIPRTIQPRTLYLSDGVHEPLNAQMIMLPPTLINYVGSLDSLYALVFVDQRFYWQYAPCDEWELGDSLPGGGREDVSVVPDTSDTGERNPEWRELIDDVISPALSELNGQTVNITHSEIDESYLRVDIESLGRVGPDNDKARNAANLLDAVAINIGAEVVVNYDGEIALINVEDDSGAGSFVRLTGGDTYAIEDLTQNVTPQNVKVIYRKIAVDGTLWGTYHSVTREAGGNIGTKVIQDTAKAICETADGDPTNEDALDSLAASIASDWYQRFRYHFDTVFQGICPVVPGPGIDVIEFTYGGYPRNITTRVRSRPENQGFDRLNHQDPEAPFLTNSKPLFVKLKDHLYCDLNGNVEASKLDINGDLITPEETVFVGLKNNSTGKYAPNVHHGISYTGDKIWVTAWRSEDGDLIYRPTSSGYQSAQGRTDGTISVGGSGTVSVYRGGGDTGVNVTAHDSQTIADSIPGSTYVDLEWRSAGDSAGRWEITGYHFECP